MPDPGLPLMHPSPPLVSGPDAPLLLPETLAINPDEILAGRWVGQNGVEDPDDLDFEGHPIPQPVEISDDEESELSSDEWWSSGTAEDLLEVLETNVELDACRAGG